MGTSFAFLYKWKYVSHVNIDKTKSEMIDLRPLLCCFFFMTEYRGLKKKTTFEIRSDMISEWI